MDWRCIVHWITSERLIVVFTFLITVATMLSALPWFASRPKVQKPIITTAHWNYWNEKGVRKSVAPQINVTLTNEGQAPSLVTVTLLIPGNKPVHHYQRITIAGQTERQELLLFHLPLQVAGDAGTPILKGTLVFRLSDSKRLWVGVNKFEIPVNIPFGTDLSSAFSSA